MSTSHVAREVPLIIRAAQASDWPAIVGHYRASGYGGSPQPDERIFVVEQEQALIGAGRLVREAGVTVLRGMRVAPEQQGRGIGRDLLTAVGAALGVEACYCISYAHLRRFYGAAGFAEIEPAAAPAFLAARLAEYRQRRPENFILMLRAGHRP